MATPGLVYLGKTRNGRGEWVGRVGTFLDVSHPHVLEEPAPGGYAVFELMAGEDVAILGVWPAHSTFAQCDPSSGIASRAQPIAQRALWSGVVFGGGRPVIVAGRSWSLTSAVLVASPRDITPEVAKALVVESRGELQTSNLVILLAGGKTRPRDSDGRVAKPANVSVRATRASRVEPSKPAKPVLAYRPVAPVRKSVRKAPGVGGLRLATDNLDGTYLPSILYSQLHLGQPSSSARTAAVRADDGHLYWLAVNADAALAVYDLTESERQGRLIKPRQATGGFTVLRGIALPAPKDQVFPGGPLATVVHVPGREIFPDSLSAEQAGFPVTGDSPLQQAARIMNKLAVKKDSPTASAGDRAARLILVVANHVSNGEPRVGDAAKLQNLLSDAAAVQQISLAVGTRHQQLTAAVQAGGNPAAENEIRALTKAMRATGIKVASQLSLTEPVSDQVDQLAATDRSA